MFSKRRERGGFTLVELVVVLAILAILTTMALTASTSIVDQTRFEKTILALDEIENAIFGSRDSGGVHGFIADIGGFPLTDNTRNDLITNLSLIPPNPVVIPSVSPYFIPNGGGQWINQGWNGPYLKVTYDSNIQNMPLKDGWGKSIITSFTPSSSGTKGGIRDATIRSPGPDGIPFNIDDLTRTYLGIDDNNPNLHGPDIYGSVTIQLTKHVQARKASVYNITAGLIEPINGACNIQYYNDTLKFDIIPNPSGGQPPLSNSYKINHVFCGHRVVYLHIPVHPDTPATYDYNEIKHIYVSPGAETFVEFYIPEDYCDIP